jgi:hypothetical protein
VRPPAVSVTTPGTVAQPARHTDNHKPTHRHLFISL